MSLMEELMTNLRDPIAFSRFICPDVTWYDKQREVLYSMEENDETIVPAGNKAGKDFLTGFKIVHTICTRHPCRIMTTSVDGDQLENVLWGEMNWWLQNSKIGLDTDKGGPLLINHMHWRKVLNGELCPISYVVGKVAKKGASLLGHHVKDIYGDGVPRAWAFMDEASGLDDLAYTMCATWADRIGIIGNPFPCHTFFKRFVEEGDQPRPNGKGFWRKIIQISAMDTPNVKYGLAQEAAGIDPTNEILLPGVLTYAQYKKRRATYPPDVACVSLDGQFWAGGDVMLFPSDSIRKSKEAFRLRGKPATGEAMGIDPAEGGDKSVWCIGDKKGVHKLVSLLTPNTNMIPGKTIELGKQYGIPPENWLFDQAFGKAHSDRLNDMGYPSRVIAFGSAVSGELRRGVRPMKERREVRDDRLAYKNRRAEMYGDLAYYMAYNDFAIPTGPEPQYQELYRQLSLIPRLTDNEGRMKMLPKKKDPSKPNEKSLTQLLGRSPDEADATVLMLHGCLHRARVGFAGAVR